jgi:hypothetical protein
MGAPYLDSEMWASGASPTAPVDLSEREIGRVPHLRDSSIVAKVGIGRSTTGGAYPAVTISEKSAIPENVATIL